MFRNLARPFLVGISKKGFQQLNFSSTSNKMSKLGGKTAIVTASTEGIGLAIAKRLAEDGAYVVVSSRKQDHVNQAVANLRSLDLKVTGVVCHVGKKEDRAKLIQHALKETGGIDILVSNAAVNPVMAQVLDTPEDAWDKIFDVNVKCAFLLSKEVLPHMEKRGGGSIIYISSIGGIAPFSMLGAYSVSKTALLGLTKAAAPQCAAYNVRVNCVLPGVVKTKFSSALWEDEASLERIQEITPMRRVAEPSEIAGIVSFLCSSDASYITGENIVVAGGMQSRL